jgi:hypothetical protein
MQPALTSGCSRGAIATAPTKLTPLMTCDVVDAAVNPDSIGLWSVIKELSVL